MKFLIRFKTVRLSNSARPRPDVIVEATGKNVSGAMYANRNWTGSMV